MNEKHVELAKLGLEEFAKQLSPHYAQVRQDLLSELALQGADLSGDVIHETQGTANYKLVTSFISTLPRFTPHDYWKGPSDNEVITNKPFEARAIQATMIWVKDYSSHYSPYYMVGTKNRTALLAKAGQIDEKDSSYSLFTLDLSKKELTRAKSQENIIYRQPYDPDASIEPLTNLNDGKLHLRGRSPGSLSIKGGEHLMGRLVSVKWLLDNELADFRVFDYLNNLAVLFKKEDVLERQFTNYLQGGRAVKKSISESIGTILARGRNQR